MRLTPGHGEEVTASKLTGMSASLKPKDGIAHDDLDLELHLEKDFFGAQSAELQYEGTGKYDDKDFTFKGPVDMFKL